MLFRPKFCANCGEKIERSEWRLWTSRRFCELCATEFQLQEYVPRIVIGLAVVASILGFGNYFGGGTSRVESVEGQNRSHQRATRQALESDRRSGRRAGLPRRRGEVDGRPRQARR